MILIGIDPDIDKCGVAYYNPDNKDMALYKLTFTEIIEQLQNWVGEKKVYIEAGWLNKKTNWHPSQGRKTGEKIAKNVGENHAVGKLLAQYCTYHDIQFALVRPSTRKLGADAFKRLTGYKFRTNSEMRDAGMLVWGREK